ncbi:MAG: ferric reductase-like transmembrane domain-containing protein [Candidatus Gracilibacteria bacterium]
MLKKLILEGQIPYFKQIRKILLLLAIITPLSVFFYPKEEALFAQIGWDMLIGVMLIRPIADIIPKIKLFRTLVLLRKEFGIAACLFIIAHFVGFLMMQDQSILSAITNPDYWGFYNVCGWGTWGLAFAMPVLLTSNIFSIITLKKWWKYIQKLAYPFFILGGVHVVMIEGGEGLWPIIVVAVLWIAAWIKKASKTPVRSSDEKTPVFPHIC